MKRPCFATRFVLILYPALVLASAPGCGTGSAEPTSDEIARTSLESALKAWQDGGKPGTVAGTKPTVEVHDTPWGAVRS